MLRRVFTVSGAVSVAVLAASAAAWADGWGTVDCNQAPTPQCQLEAGVSAPPQGGAPGPRPTDEKPGSGVDANLPTCVYTPSEFEGSPGGPGWRPPGAWYQGSCSLTGVIRAPVLVPGLAAEDVARLARAQLGLPDPVLAASPAGAQLVHLPTWLWLADAWAPVTATASVPGVSVTATATPVSVAWLMGDGATVTCHGPGTRFRPGSDPRAGSPDCGHIYPRSSAAQPDGAYAVRATVRWTVTWAGAGESGTFLPMTTSSATRFRVVESQAFNTLPGPR